MTRTIISLLISANLCFGQAIVDSLITTLNNSPDEKKILIYTEIIYELRNNDPIKALDYFDEAIVIAEDHGDSNLLSDLYAQTAHSLITLGDFDKAKEYLEISINYHSNLDYDSIHHGLMLLSFMEYKRENFAQSLAYSQQLADIVNKDSLHSIAFIYNNIGDTYFRLEKFDSSYLYHNNAELIFNKTGYKTRTAIAQQYKSRTLNALGRYKEAYKTANESLSKFYEKPDDIDANPKFEIARTKKILADSHIGLNEFDKAESLLNESISYFMQTDNSVELSTCYLSLSNLYNEKGDVKKGKSFYRLATDTLNDFKLRDRDRILNLHKLRFEKEKQNTLEQATEIAIAKTRNYLFLALIFFALIIASISLFGYYTKRRLSKQLANRNLELNFLNKKFTQFLENAGEAFRLIDSDGKIILWNNENYRITGITKEIAIGAYLWDIITIISPQIQELKNYKERIKNKRLKLLQNDSKEMLTFESNIVDTKGNKKSLITTCFPIFVGEEKFIGEISRDITENKKHEKDLVAAKEKAEASDRMKSEFLAQMSHEIRTPINTILSFTSLIKAEAEDKLDPDFMETFSSINRAGNRIIRTIDLLLNMSEIQTGLYDFIPIQLDIYEDVIATNLPAYKIVASEKGLEFSVEKKCKLEPVSVDEYSINQIFQNLLDNAFKYTEKGFVKIVIDTNEKGNPIIDIIDSGIGISEEFLDQLFKPFSQEEQGYTRKFEGNGLGLALVKQYCDLNNLSIEAFSKKGKGSTFRVTLVEVINDKIKYSSQNRVNRNINIRP